MLCTTHPRAPRPPLEGLSPISSFPFSFAKKFGNARSNSTGPVWVVLHSISMEGVGCVRTPLSQAVCSSTLGPCEERENSYQKGRELLSQQIGRHSDRS